MAEMTGGTDLPGRTVPVVALNDAPVEPAAPIEPDVTQPQVADAAQAAPDASSDYIRHRETLSGDKDLEALMERVRSRQGTEQGEETPKAPEALEAGPKIEVRPFPEGGYGGWVDGQLMAGGQTPEDAMRAARAAAAEKSGTMETMGGAAADLGKGIVEAPRQAFGGVVDAVKETSQAIDDLGDWLNENVADLTFTVDIPGVDDDETVDLDPTTLIQRLLPDIDEATSATGGAIRSIAQFITGFWGAGKVLRAGGLAAPTAWTGKMAEAVGRGAMADFTAFDPTEERLSNVLRDVAGLEDPVTEYLAANEEDSRIEGRIKNALEGIGLGAFTDTFLIALRGIRGVLKARAGKQADSAAAIMAEQRERFGEAADRDFLALGDPASEEIVVRRPTVTGKVAEAAGDIPDVRPGALSEESSGEVFINWARIDTPEDVKRAIQGMADLSREGIDTARRGVRSNEETAAAAARLNAWDVLVSRREGQPLNAEESLALRQLWTAATEKLTELAKRAAADPGEVNMFAFRKMLAIQDAIQKEAIAARTETARALQSWRIPAGGGVERARAVQEVLARNADDPTVHRELARRIAVLGETGDLTKLNEVAQRSVTARTYDAVVQAWINGLLSGPKTHLVNMMSNTSVIFLTMAERATAARIAYVMGDDASVQLGEATAEWFGMVEGLKDALRISSNAERMGTVWRNIRTGESAFGAQKIDQPRQGALASEVWNVASDSGLGRTLDVLNVVTQIPGRALGAEDELFKTIGYRMELHAQALRQARSEMAAGSLPESALKDRVAEIVAHPPEHIRLSALDAATYQTFNSAAGKISQAIMKYRNAVPVLGPLTAPFIRTVGNIGKYTFIRTPLAPLMADFRADIAAGGARADTAMARLAIGSSVMMLAADLTMSGQITGKGPSDPELRAAQRRAGIQPYSIKVGDRWYAYNRMDPIGSMIGLSADMVDVLANGDMTDEKWNEDVERAVIATIAAIGSNAMNKTYMTGMADFVEALADPTRNAEYWAQGVVGSFMPTVAAEARRADDPYMREVRSMWEAIENRTPGLSKDLPLRRDLWGRPIEYRSGMGVAFDALSPIYSRKENPEPIDTELLRLGNGPSMPPRRTAFNGVVINLDQYEGAYSRFVELAGNAQRLPKYGNKGALDALNDVVTGKSPFSVVYNMRSDGPDGGKMTFIRNLVSEYREAAKKALLAEYPQITVEIRRKSAAQKKWNIQ